MRIKIEFIDDFFLLIEKKTVFTGLALNTSSLTARRDSFDRNTSAFSPSLDYTSSSVAAVAANGNGNTNRKWPVNNYGALSTMASVSPLAPGTPPPTGNKSFEENENLISSIYESLLY